MAPRFECNCSRARIGRMLLSLGREEVDSIVAERRSVSVTCEFCNARYEFDAVDVGQLFASGSTGGTVRGTALSSRRCAACSQRPIAVLTAPPEWHALFRPA